MPSKDPMNEKAWSWLGDAAKRRVTASQARSRARRRIAQSAAYVVDLARRSGSDPDALADRVPEDTLRRLKYPMHVHINEGGTRRFEHDLGIVEGAKSLTATDRGTGGEYQPLPERDESGKFKSRQ